MVSSDRPSAVILGGGFVGLGAARVLAKYGVPVTVIDPQVCICQFSRSVHRCLRSPSTEDEAAYIDFLESAAAEDHLAGSVVFPTIDDGIQILAQQWQRFSRVYRLTIPEWETTQYLHDKRLLPQIALPQGVPIPGTCIPAGPEDLDRVDLEFPLVLKPAVSTRLKVLTNKKAYRVDNREDLIATYKMLAALIDPRDILVQEWIPGGADQLYSYFGYFKHGELVAGYAARRLRQDPMDFGRLTTYAVTLEQPELERLSIRLLSGVGYTGLAEVEFMWDRKHSRFEMLEVNPRLWGWHSLAGHAGVDLSYLAYCDAIQQRFPIGSFRAGVKWVRLTGDIPLAVKEILAGRLSIAKYLRSLWGSRDAVFSWSDPIPFLAEIVLTAIHILNVKLARRSPRQARPMQSV